MHFSSLSVNSLSIRVAVAWMMSLFMELATVRSSALAP